MKCEREVRKTSVPALQEVLYLWIMSSLGKLEGNGAAIPLMEGDVVLR